MSWRLSPPNIETRQIWLRQFSSATTRRPSLKWTRRSTSSFKTTRKWHIEATRGLHRLEIKFKVRPCRAIRAILSNHKAISKCSTRPCSMLQLLSRINRGAPSHSRRNRPCSRLAQPSQSTAPTRIRYNAIPRPGIAVSIGHRRASSNKIRNSSIHSAEVTLKSTIRPRQRCIQTWLISRTRACRWPRCATRRPSLPMLSWIKARQRG